MSIPLGSFRPSTLNPFAFRNNIYTFATNATLLVHSSPLRMMTTPAPPPPSPLPATPTTNPLLNRNAFGAVQPQPLRRPSSSQPEQQQQQASEGSGLTKVANFRDVGRNYNADVMESPSSESEKQPVLKVGNLFRSARLDDSTPQDVETLKNRYGIRTVIDLRSDLERKDCQHVSSTFLFPVIEQEMESELSPLKTNDDINPKPPIESSYSDTDESDADYFGPRNPPVDAASIGSITPGGGRRHRYSIEFAGHNFRRHGVWKPLGVWQKCKVVALIASGNKPRAVQMIGEEAIAPKGLIGLYHNFADYCGGEIVQALKLMAVPENFPVLVHCTQGKDRTGMVIAMALHCAGVSVEHIVTDFHRSQGGLDSQRDVMVQEMAKTGLDPSFSDAPANVLSDTIKYIIDKHGSVENYLSKHGFDKEWQDRLRDNLVEKRPVTRSK